MISARFGRIVHDEAAGRELTPEELQVQEAFIDAEAHVSRGVTRLKNLLEKRQDLSRPPWLLVERVRDLETWGRTMRALRKEQGL